MIRKHGLQIAMLVGCLLFGFQGGICEDDASYKADFILKLTDYVQWPARVGGSVVIAVVGECPLLSPLTAKAAEKSAAGTKVTVRKLTASDTVAGCQIVFIPTADKAELAKILKQIGTSPILTVSDAKGFAGFGVIVNFFKDEQSGKVKFEINTLAATDAGLKVSSQLLKLAKII